MNRHYLSSAAVSVLAALVIAMPAIADRPSRQDSRSSDSAGKNEQQSQQYHPDNTGVNSRDRNDARRTADDQALGDTDTVSKIRSAIVRDDALSTYAQNVKIISDNGKIVLRGPVKNDKERQMVAQKAADVVGATNVRNELEVATRRQG